MGWDFFLGQELVYTYRMHKASACHVYSNKYCYQVAVLPGRSPLTHRSSYAAYSAAGFMRRPARSLKDTGYCTIAYTGTV